MISKALQTVLQIVPKTRVTRAVRQVNNPKAWLRIFMNENQHKKNSGTKFIVFGMLAECTFKRHCGFIDIEKDEYDCSRYSNMKLSVAEGISKYANIEKVYGFPLIDKPPIPKTVGVKKSEADQENSDSNLPVLSLPTSEKIEKIEDDIPFQ